VGQQCYLVSTLAQTPGEEIDDALNAAIQFWRNGNFGVNRDGYIQVHR
jgi:hypothetical protein